MNNKCPDCGGEFVEEQFNYKDGRATSTLECVPCSAKAKAKIRPVDEALTDLYESSLRTTIAAFDITSTMTWLGGKKPTDIVVLRIDKKTWEDLFVKVDVCRRSGA